jgi:hypothetical protein
MPIATRCPQCKAKLKGPDNLVGHTLKCPRCGTHVAITAALLVPAAARQPPKPPPAAAKPATNATKSVRCDDAEIIYDDLEIIDDDVPMQAQPPPRPVPDRPVKPKPAPRVGPKEALPVKAPGPPAVIPNLSLDKTDESSLPVFPDMNSHADHIKLRGEEDEEIPLIEVKVEEVVFDEFELVDERLHPEIPELPEIIEEEILEVLPVEADDDELDELEVVEDVTPKSPKRRRRR